jgi:hypothetical protein
MEMRVISDFGCSISDLLFPAKVKTMHIKNQKIKSEIEMR